MCQDPLGLTRGGEEGEGVSMLRSHSSQLGWETGEAVHSVTKVRVNQGTLAYNQD